MVAGMPLKYQPSVGPLTAERGMSVYSEVALAEAQAYICDDNILHKF
jgi:hypothetical protein